MHVVVTLQRPDAAGEEAALAAAREGRAAPMSVRAFADRFGVPAATSDAAKAWLGSTGMRVVSVSAARDQLAADGPAGAVSQLFATPLHAFDSPDGRFVANTAAPQLPGNLGIVNVIGLNTLQQLHAAGRAPGPGAGHLPAGHLHRRHHPARTCGRVYEQPAAHVGAGQRVAIFGEGQTDGVVSDLRAFESRLPAAAGRRSAVEHPAGDTDFSDDSGHTEWNIDTQASTGMAPDVSGLDPVLRLRSVRRRRHQGVQPLHRRRGPAAAGVGELRRVRDGAGGQPVAEQPGDQPDRRCRSRRASGNNLGRHADRDHPAGRASRARPSSSPPGTPARPARSSVLPVIGAGNGVLNQGVADHQLAGLAALRHRGRRHRALHRRPRRTAPASTAGRSPAAAPSLFTPAPDYQQGTAGLTLPCVTDPTSDLPRHRRRRPRSPATSLGNGYDIVANGEFTEGGGGGTSLSSPLWAGMWTRIQSGVDRPPATGFANYAPLPGRQERHLLRPGLLRRQLHRPRPPACRPATAPTPRCPAGTT